MLIADEPTTALDVTIQAQILERSGELRDETGAAVLLITHDLGVVADIADRVAVMYGGRIVEEGTLDEVFYDPQHPYTWGLLGSITRVDRPRPARLPSIGGQPPSLLDPPEGCHFRARCPHAHDALRRPRRRCEVSAGHPRPLLARPGRQAPPARRRRADRADRRRRRRAAGIASREETLLDVEGLEQHFKVRRGRGKRVHAVDGVTLAAARGADAGAGRRVGLRQVDAGAGARAPVGAERGHAALPRRGRHARRRGATCARCAATCRWSSRTPTRR